MQHQFSVIIAAILSAQLLGFVIAAAHEQLDGDLD
jgi:hypothetical protein